jgi:predicted peptidase
MSRSRLFVAAAVVAITIAASAAALRSRRAQARTQPNVTPDTIVGPLVNGGFNVRMIDYQGQRYFYQVFLPRDYTPTKRWPVIFALHGGRTRGSDNVAQTREGLANVVRERAESFPAVVIFPQVPARVNTFQFIPTDLAIIDQELKALNGDSDRVYLTGVSFGGLTAYQMAYLHPERFAALVPVAAAIDVRPLGGTINGANDPILAEFAKRFRSIPVWIFVGERDEEVGAPQVRQNAQALKDGGVEVRYTELKDAPHNIFTRAYSTPELVPWLLAQRRQP